MGLDTDDKYSCEQEQEQISRLKNLGAVNKKAGKELKHIAKKRTNGEGAICKPKGGLRGPVYGWLCPRDQRIIKGQTSCPALFDPFRTFPRVGQVVGHLT